MTQLIGLVGGTVFYEQELFSHGQSREIETPYGGANIIVTDRLAYIPRHGLKGGAYILPHKINHPANFAALKTLGVGEVIGVSSSGSLKPSIVPGSIVLPNDYICLYGAPTAVRDTPRHITPVLDHDVRDKLAKAAANVDITIIDGGVYWQTTGPRLETKAEIIMISDYAHIVGMTLASEAIVAQELDMKYASLCTVDNYAHGLSATPLTEEEIRTSASASSTAIFTIIEAYLHLAALS